MIYNNLLDLIGNTPVVKVDFKDENIADVYVKLEKFNLSGSVKDRAALGMIETAEKEGLLKEGSVIIEPTSGNTGIALALIGRLKGYKVIIVMPDTMSIERRATLKAYGAELILTDGTKGMGEAIAIAEKLAAENPNYFLPQQFNNKANPEKHYETTGKELLDDFKIIDAFVAGVGTGGTVMGIGKRIKENFPNVKICPLEPLNSPTLSTGYKVAKHRIEGISDEFIPDLVKLDKLDKVVSVDDGDAIIMAQKLAKCGLGVGISSGANFIGALILQNELGKDSVIVTVFPDDNKKYLSTDLMREEKIKEDFLSKDITLKGIKNVLRVI